MIREPVEATIGEDCRVEIPLGLLAEAGLDPGGSVLVFSDGDGRIVVRRATDSIRDLMEHGHP
ncbi:hypothetical protein ACWGN9_23110 [Streptomyces sp. NPDC055775]